ncbi:hypothetical protein PTTG_07161 [Puccinia triticina 1-1 BBBD Race 1]|uniref:PPR_long domain-containing protein n=2 Tax=Puccinia triticina TaxID=208348 RepID=A0A180GEY8_PUCT1|nr:uncharacterized protein PtA15_15A237 [Puccinia triticina]OAV91225.1 hypothetical protein PTTG_07161 [Puccinia triticina 1-1 BBBD Race 1]WAQ91845.1 hypothetical protein PtA15_15A237 [Puccinia triticina]WAR62640.1 hypothetical protein PtB15_15B227 [Puccinia triticina]
MLLPKFATHISPFKLSHFANRGHQHIQSTFRNTFNFNLSSTVGQNSHNLSNSTTATGLGSSTSGSSASGGAGGAKWNAGSRTNWNQQAHSRLLTQTNATSQDGLGSRWTEDDEDRDELRPKYLSTIGIYNKRNRTISSRWQHEQNVLNSTSSLGLEGVNLQVTCKTAFVEPNSANSTGDPSTESLDQILASSHELRSYSNSSTRPYRPLFINRKPSRRHSIHCIPASGSIVTDSTTHARRFSTGNLALSESTWLSNPTDSARAARRDHSTVAPQSQPGLGENGPLMTNPSPRSDKLDPNQPQSFDQQWLQRATHTILTTDQNYHSTFYQLRRMLDSYISSTTQPSSDVIDLLFWGMVANKPNQEPIDNLLKCHHFLLQNTAFQPTPQTYSILLSALCRRDLNNAKEVLYRRTRLAHLAVNQQLNQSLPNLSLVPVDASEDNKVSIHLDAEPNYLYATRLFDSLDREIIKQLQPATLENLIQASANINLFDPDRSKVNPAARLELATKAFKILEDRQELTAESYSNLIVLLGFTNKLPQATALFESYKQSRSDPDSQSSTRVHQHALQPPSSLTRAAPDSLTVQRCQAEPVSEDSDSRVLLSLMRVHLAAGDTFSAVTLLEESLRPTVDPLSTFKSSAEHILEVILGFIRLGDYSSASTWIKRLFSSDPATYHLNDPNRRREFMDRIVSQVCGPTRGFEGIGVAYDAAMISIDQIDFQFDSRGMAALMARLRNVLNSALVNALHQSACLNSLAHPDNPAMIVRIQDSLEKACSIVCYLITKRAALLKADNEKVEAISDLQTYGMIENFANRVIQSCAAVKNQWIGNRSEELMGLGRFSDGLLVRLMSHYSTLPDIRDVQAVSLELRQQSSYLTGLLTSYQSLLQPIPGSDDHPTLLQHQFKFGLQITTPMILNNLSLTLASQFHKSYASTPGNDLQLTSINDWAILLSIGAILEIQAREGKTADNKQSVLEPLMARFGAALRNPHLQVDQLDPTFDLQLLLRVIHHYRLKTTPADPRLQAFFTKLQQDFPSWQSESSARFEYYAKQADTQSSNRFGKLREGQTPLESSPGGVPPVSHSQPPSPCQAVPSRAPVASSPPATAEFSLPAERPAFKTFNEQLSQVALSMFCSKDEHELNRLHRAVQESTNAGHYLSADALSALIETFGRLGQLDRLREMYVNAHMALASLDSTTNEARALRSISWTRVEDRMIIGLAYCGLLDEVAIHKSRLLDNGYSPSADAYAAMIQHAQETTDDASMALNYFDEANRNKVSPNTFLCNTIISKLSKARRSKEALQVFELMKSLNVMRNSVTFGAIINAVSKTGDEAKAEELFQEMLVSKNFKPRIPPFNTMIQLFTQHAKQPNREKVLHYYGLMQKYELAPSDHTYNLLMQAYGMIEPCEPAAMERVFRQACADRKVSITGAHWSTFLNVKGCVEKDLEGAMALFERISRDPSGQPRYHRRGGAVENVVRLPDAVCYEALFNVFLAFKRADLVPAYMARMKRDGVHMTAYVVNTLMKVYAASNELETARRLFESLVDPPPGQPALFNHPQNSPKPTAPSHLLPVNGSVGSVDDPVYREPSCYETMIRIEFGAGNLDRVQSLLERLDHRNYPAAIVSRIKKIVSS